MSLELIESYPLEGPSIYFPQPGVAATIHADTDVRAALGDAIKSWAQAVGVIIGYLRIQAVPAPSGEGVRLLIRFTCNHPLIGLTLLQHALADLRAAAAGDEDWNHDEQLFDLRRRRMREDPSLPLLQIRAEAQGRGIPLLPVGDGQLQLGTGKAAWRFDPAQLSVGMSVNPPWPEIAIVPLIAVTGAHASALAQQIAHAIQGSGLYVLEHGSWQAIHAALTDPAVECLIVCPDVAESLERGLAFNRSLIAVIDPLDPAVDPLSPWALAAGLPALVTDEVGAVIAQAADPRGVDLAERSAALPLLLQPHTPLPKVVDPLIQAVAQAVAEYWFS